MMSWPGSPGWESSKREQRLIATPSVPLSHPGAATDGVAIRLSPAASPNAVERKRMRWSFPLVESVTRMKLGGRAGRVCDARHTCEKFARQDPKPGTDGGSWCRDPVFGPSDVDLDTFWSGNR